MCLKNLTSKGGGTKYLTLDPFGDKWSWSEEESLILLKIRGSQDLKNSGHKELERDP